MTNKYNPTRYGIIIKNTDNPTHIIGAHLTGHTIVIEFVDGYTRDDADTLVRAWYPTATMVKQPVTVDCNGRNTHTDMGDKNMFHKLIGNENGQTVLECFIILACIVIVALVACTWLIGQMDVVETLLPNALGL